MNDLLSGAKDLAEFMADARSAKDAVPRINMIRIHSDNFKHIKDEAEKTGMLVKRTALPDTVFGIRLDVYK